MQHNFANIAAQTGHTPKLVSEEDTKRRVENALKRKDGREKSHFYSGLQEKRGPNHGSEQWD